MNTYLLTWNPKRWNWDQLDSEVSALKSFGFFDATWSSGGTKRIEHGDRVYLMRLGVEPRGIMASGFAISNVYQDTHWDSNREDLANYIDVRFDALLHPEMDGVLPLTLLQSGQTPHTNWTPQASGISIEPTSAAYLETLWQEYLLQNGQSPIQTPEEISTPTLYYEGASRQISVNAYERNPRARKACIEHFGVSCCVCGFNFEATYGDIGRNFIHVHHLVPISGIGESYSVDPISDLRPVCPNCHAMLHHSSSEISIDTLQKRLLR